MILKTAFRGIRESVMDSLRIQRGVRGIGKLPSYCDQMPLRGSIGGVIAQNF